MDFNPTNKETQIINATTTVTTPKKRIFSFNGMELVDPDPAMPPDKVCEFHALMHSALTNAGVKGPVIAADGTEQYKFEVKIGNFG